MVNNQSRKRIFYTLVLISLTVVLTGTTFNYITSNLGSILEVYKTESPDVLALGHGQKVEIDGEVVEVIGDDECGNGAGETYPCWIFSLTPGDGKQVLLSNGTSEIWTTASSGPGRFHFLRPNGDKVQAM